MLPSDADHNLLFGILAMQMDFISRDTLTVATSMWVKDKSRPLSQILLESKMLDEDGHRLLVTLVEKHLQQHDNDVAKSLESVRSLAASIWEDITRVGDDDIHSTLFRIAEAQTVEAPTARSDTADPNHTLVSTPSSLEFETGDPTSGERFQILRSHAKGGLGQVSVAVDRELNREVALKEIQPQHADSSDNRLRFLQEAEITGQLEHPGIVPVYGLGQYATGRPFYAMRFIRGNSLSQAINEFHASATSTDAQAERAVEFRKLLGHFIDVCNAIEYAHSRGILHRDLKPDNVMLGTYGETLVVDWGLAKAIGDDGLESHSVEPILRLTVDSASAPTQVGSVIGTPAYMSPEQAAGRLADLGPASDVYSLGATLYCLLTGQAPITDTTLAIALIKIEQSGFPRPRELQPAIPVALEAVCLKALSRQQSDRYQSARELADDVQRYLADEAVAAHVEPRSAQAKRWMRKHPRAMTAAAVSVLLGLTSLATVSGIVSYKNRQLADANDDLLQANTAERVATSEAQGTAKQLEERNIELQSANEAERKAKSEAETTADKLAATNRDLQLANEAERAATRNADAKRKEAELARQRAQEARDEAKAVADYLVNAFRSADPTRDGREITVAEVLDRAAAELDEQLQDDPLVVAALSDAIGRTYRGLGLYPQAISVLKRSQQTREELLGATHEDTLQSSSNLAAAHLSAGDLQKALPIFEGAWTAWKAKLGLDSSEALAAMNDLATAYRLAGDTVKSLSLSKEALDLTTTKLGTEHLDTLTAMNNLASAYRASRELTEAIPLFEETLRLSEATLGTDHPNTAQAINNLAAAYLDTEQTDKAIPLFERSVDLDLKRFGPDHPNTLKSMNNLATSYFVAGQHVKALPLLEEGVASARAKLGDDHPDALKAMNNLAASYFLVGQTAKAFPLLEEGFTFTQAKLGPEHPDTQKALMNVVNAYRENDELEKALPHLESTLKLLIAKFGIDHPTTRTSMRSLASNYLAASQPVKATAIFERFLAVQRQDDPQLAATLAAFTHELLDHKQYEAAEKYGRQCLEICNTILPNHWLRPASQSLLGGALAGQDKSSEAERFLLAGYEGLNKRRDAGSANNLFEATQRIVTFYESQSRDDEAAKWRLELDKLPMPKVR